MADGDFRIELLPCWECQGTGVGPEGNPCPACNLTELVRTLVVDGTKRYPGLTAASLREALRADE